MTHIVRAPPTMFVTRVTAQSRSSPSQGPFSATAAVTGTRKFSVNSSLRARSRATNPTENAIPASTWLPVASLTTR